MPSLLLEEGDPPNLVVTGSAGEWLEGGGGVLQERVPGDAELVVLKDP